VDASRCPKGDNVRVASDVQVIEHHVNDIPYKRSLLPDPRRRTQETDFEIVEDTVIFDGHAKVDFLPLRKLGRQTSRQLGADAVT
jgi:hypothetical protein